MLYWKNVYSDGKLSALLFLLVINFLVFDCLFIEFHFVLLASLAIKTKWVIVPIILFSPSHPACNPIPRGLGCGGRAERKFAGLFARGREPVSGAAQGCDATGLRARWRELAKHSRQLPVPLILLVTRRLPACPASLQPALVTPDCRAHLAINL